MATTQSPTRQTRALSGFSAAKVAAAAHIGVDWCPFVVSRNPKSKNSVDISPHSAKRADHSDVARLKNRKKKKQR
jgi:hypothetical protein